MKQISLWILIGLVSAACTNNTNVFKAYNCDSQNADTKTILDAYQRFSLQIPKHWKTELFMDANTSIFAAADTIKQMSQTYLLKTTETPGHIELDSLFEAAFKAKALVNHQQIKTIDSGTFKNHKAYVFYSIPEDTTSKSSTVQLYFNSNQQYYFEIEIRFFNRNFQKNLMCEAVSVINSLNINE